MPACALSLQGPAESQVFSHSAAYGTGNQTRAPSLWELDLAQCLRETGRAFGEEEEKGLSSQNSREGEQGMRG